MSKTGTLSFPESSLSTRQATNLALSTPGSAGLFGEMSPFCPSTLFSSFTILVAPKSPIRLTSLDPVLKSLLNTLTLST